MFKAYYGQCKMCPPNTTRLIVVKSLLCKEHNEKQKNIGKPKKVPKPKVPIKKKVRYGLCIDCKGEEFKVLSVRNYCFYHNEKRKKEEKSKRVVKLINKAENKKSIKYLVGELDRIFSIFIRKRDSNKDGYGKCITCPTTKHYLEMDCGHFITRGAKAVRWNEYNCALQCKICNGFKGGEQDLFAKAINKRWGENTAENLQIKRHFSKKLDRFNLEFLIKEYEQKIKQLDAR